MALTDKQKSVLRHIVTMLSKAGIVYQISGGTAAILYGVDRETFDIDIDIHKRDFARVKELFKHFLIQDYHKYYDPADMDFDMYLMNFIIDGVPVEFGQVEDAKILGIGNSTWTDLPVTLDRAMTITLDGVSIKVQRKEDLIAYKRTLGRDVDKVDVDSLVSIFEKQIYLESINSVT